MAKKNKRQDIADTIVRITEQSSLKDVHVAKVIKELDINRNTFYYYFESKYDVVMFVFLQDLDRRLREAVAESELVFTDIAQGGKETFAFYFHREIAARTLDFSDFFRVLVQCVMEKPTFYSKLFNENEHEFKLRIHALYKPVVESDLRFIVGGRYMPQETFDLLLSLYVSFIYFIPSYHLANPSSSEALLDARINPFGNMPHEALVHALHKHPITRLRR